MLIISTTFLYPAPPSIIPGSDDRNIVMTDGATKIKELVSEALGGLPVSCIQPAFSTSTDDTVAYVFAGTQPKGDSMWKLVKTADLEGRDCRSIYEKVDSQSNMCGFRIKLTFTFNAAGQMAPLFISVTGLSEKELPSETCRSGMLVMKVKGLAIGANVKVECESVGYVVFLRKCDTNELDTRRFAYYRDEVYIPFIENIRKSMGYEPGTPVPEAFTVVSSQDGDAEQRRVLTDERRLEREGMLRIITNKHNPARTGTEQPADLTPVFRMLKQQGGRTTSAGMQSTLRTNFERDYAALGSALNIKPTHFESLKDFILSAPEILAKSATATNIRAGFLEVGLIDRKSFSFPDIKQIIYGTTRRLIFQEEYNNLLNNFTSLYLYAAKHGHVPDDILEAHGILRDADMYGKEVRREAGISNESCQRAKCLSHKYVQQERRDRFEELAAKVQDKVDEEKAKVATLLEYNIECESTLRKLLAADKIEVVGSHEFANAALKHFALSKLLAKHLKAFAHARRELKKGQAWPKKGTLADAESGQDVMIKVAFDCRIAAVRIEKETVPSVSDSENDEDLVLQQQDWDPDYKTVTVVRKSAADEMFNITNGWRDKVKAAFDHMDTIILPNDVNDQGSDGLQEETNILLKLLWARLDQHIIDRVPQSKRKHWIWQFIRKNLSRVAAVMILFDHVVHDLERFATNPKKCLLRNVSSQGRSFVPLVVGTSDSFTSAAKKTEGCYLYFDQEEAVWIRSGKVCGRTFAERHKEHKKSSELKCEMSRQSRFYTHYPSKTATAAPVRSRRGFYDDLTVSIFQRVLVSSVGTRTA